MRILITAVVLMGFAGNAAAQLKSPDGRYEIIYRVEGEYVSQADFKDTRTGKVIHTELISGYMEKSFREIAWSKDSKYVALMSRGTRTTSDVEVLRFEGEVVKKLDLPDYRLNILGRNKQLVGGRYHWVNQLRWEDSKLTFRCAGQWKDGSGDPAVDPDNWYHFDVTIQLGDKTAPLNGQLIGVVAVDEAVKIE